MTANQLSTHPSALLVVDMQNGFLADNGSLAKIGMSPEALAPAVPGCRRLVDSARHAGVPIIFTRYVYMHNYADGGLLPNELIPAMKQVNSLTAGSWDADIVAELTPLEHEVVIDKSRPSAFYGTRLEPVLTGLGLRHLVVAGITTNMCVESTVRDAGQRDYHTYVAEDATAEYDEERHRVALTTMGFGFGWLTTVDEVVRQWEQRSQTAALASEAV